MAILAPLLPSDPEANLPACCRTHGKHHCMMTGGPTDGGASLAAEKCPYFPKASSASHVGATIKRTTTCAELLAHPVSVPPAEPGYRQSIHRSHHQRGPPSPLVCSCPQTTTLGGLNVSDNFILLI